MQVDRPALVQRIHVRVDTMLADGWIEEVECLIAKGMTSDWPASQAIGYVQIMEHLRGDLSYEAMSELIKIKTRQLAKRQMTWFRRFEGVEWVSPKFNTL